MKRILSFFAAVAVAGLTQAVTINWDSVKGAVDLGTKTSSGSIAVGTSEGQANLGSGSWTIAAKLAAGSISAYTNAGHKYPAIIGFGTSETKKDAYRFRANCSASGGTNTGSIGFEDNITRTEASDVALTSNTTYDFVISFDSQTSTVNFYLNDTLYGTLSNFTGTVTDIVWGKSGATNSNMDLWNNNSGTYSLDLDYVAGMTYDEVKASVIPEPTALALLALGAAGLALRRKAA